jgi:hypothetical protein
VSERAIAELRLQCARAHSNPGNAHAASTKWEGTGCAGGRPFPREKCRWLFQLAGATLCAGSLFAASRLIPRPPQAPIERTCDLLPRPRPADERAGNLPRRVPAELSRCPSRPASRRSRRAPSLGADIAVTPFRSDAVSQGPLQSRSARRCRDRQRQAGCLPVAEVSDKAPDIANMRQIVYLEPPTAAVASVHRVDLVPNGWGRRPSNHLCIDRSTVLTPSSMHIDGYC